MPSQDAGEPASLFRDREMPAPPDLGLHRAQLCPHLLLDRDPLELEPPVPGLRADVREPQEVERLRLPVAAPGSILGGVPPELDQPRLLRLQLQTELREPVAEIGEEPL